MHAASVRSPSRHRGALGKKGGRWWWSEQRSVSGRGEQSGARATGEELEEMDERDVDAVGSRVPRRHASGYVSRRPDAHE